MTGCCGRSGRSRTGALCSAAGPRILTPADAVKLATSSIKATDGIGEEGGGGGAGAGARCTNPAGGTASFGICW